MSNSSWKHVNGQALNLILNYKLDSLATKVALGLYKPRPCKIQVFERALRGYSQAKNALRRRTVAWRLLDLSTSYEQAFTCLETFDDQNDLVAAALNKMVEFATNLDQALEAYDYAQDQTPEQIRVIRKINEFVSQSKH